MKLRNKKTGLKETLTLIDFNIDDDEKEIDLSILLDESDGECIDKQFYSLDDLKNYLSEWEDYTPAEPLIKDEKVRKFVRDWAEHWEIDKVVIRFIDNNRIDLIGFPSSSETGREIDIQRTVVRNEIIYGNRYTIAELCGEEEE